MKDSRQQLHHQHSSYSSSSSSSFGDRSKSTLNTEQVQRLLDVIDEEFEVNGRGNFPTLKICLRRLIRSVNERVKAKNLEIKRAKMNGGAASYVLAAPNGRDGDLTFSDVDVIFDVDLNPLSRFDGFKEAVLAALFDFLPEGANKDKITSGAMKDAYVRRMAKINSNGDVWSLITLNNHVGRCIELKFVDKIRRQFEFSVDSFQIHLDWLLTPISGSKLSISGTDSAISSSKSSISGFESSISGSVSDLSDTESIIPEAQIPSAITAESVYGDFNLALRHLNHKLIDTIQPELIRGGGLLKYVHLLTRGYRPARNPREFRRIERYMCSRFFIDFNNIEEQERRLRAYLDNHLRTQSIEQKFNFLSLLYHVVDESTVCLMNHERRSSLNLIGQLAFEVETELYYQNRLFAVHSAAVGPPNFDQNNNFYMKNHNYNHNNNNTSNNNAAGHTGAGHFIDLVALNHQHQGHVISPPPGAPNHLIPGSPAPQGHAIPGSPAPQGHVISAPSSSSSPNSPSPFKHTILFVPHNASFWIPVV